MMGAASMTWRLPSWPASTGQQPVFWQAATCWLAHSGGSVIERNAPPDTVMIRWAATSAAGSAVSLGGADPPYPPLVRDGSDGKTRHHIGPVPDDRIAC